MGTLWYSFFMGRGNLLFIPFLLLVSGSAFAAVEQPASYAICRSHKQVRTIRVEKDGSGACQTKYTKKGIDRIVGTGRYEETCNRFFNNIKNNLETASWKCKSFKKVSIVTPDSED